MPDTDILRLDIVVPVFDEAATLEASITSLHDHLTRHVTETWRITVADNASTDGTPALADDLARRLRCVTAVHLAEKGRGRALKQVWAASPADVLVYLDEDLSTDLSALGPLVAPLLSGHSDLAIGTRLSRSSRVVRGGTREFVSRSYNFLLRRTMGVGFSDAQCGFKAVRADVAAELLPLVEDTAWFFDTELLVLAERCRLRIHEVPVDWWDDPDSRVDVVGTALDDLRGMRRVHRALRRGELPVEQIRERVGRNAPVGGVVGGQVVRFALVGATTTLLHLALFAVLATAFAPQPSNLLALLVATVVNTSANRRWTFGLSGARGALRHQAQGLAIFGATWAMTAGGLAALGAVLPHAPTPLQTLVVGGCTVAATVAKFALMRRW